VKDVRKRASVSEMKERGGEYGASDIEEKWAKLPNISDKNVFNGKSYG
jgi:hypothetical protein